MMSGNTTNDLDDALDDSFPASDPVSMTDPTHGMKLNAVTPADESIRQRAYELWQRAGSPDGRHEEHWQQAKQELENERPGTPTTAEEVR